MRKYLSILIFLACAAATYAQDPVYPPAPPALQNIVAAEYFINTDPGVGNGLAISISPAVDINNMPVSINVTGLSNGVNRLFIRTRNGEGHWSVATAKEFLYDAQIIYVVPPAAPQNITSAEYFIDVDPGFGNGTAIAITPGIDINNLPVTISTTGLTNATHRLYLRTRNNEGRWSITSVKEFIVDFDFTYTAVPSAPQNIIAAEYFIDTDPGFGAGTAILLTPGADINNLAFTVNTTGLPAGSTHQLYLRTRSNEGHWSSTNRREFVVVIVADPVYPPSPAAPLNITAAEYFLDTDPGFGSGTSIAVTPGLDISNLPFSINTTGLPAGSTHRFYTRTKNAEGGWSVTTNSEFVVIIVSDPLYPSSPVAPQNMVAAEYFIDTDPGFGAGTSIAVTPALDINNLNFSVNTTGLPAGSTHQVYTRTKNAEGRWSITNAKEFVVIISSDPVYTATPAAPQNVLAAEYFIDTDPGFGSATSIPLTPGVDISNLSVTVNTTGLSDGAHTLYLRTLNAEGRWSLTNKAAFGTSLLSITPPDSLLFVNTPVTTTSILNVVITNSSTVSQTINTAVTAAPFSLSFAGAITINAGQSATLPISFTPADTLLYQNTLSLGTSAGNYTVALKGKGEKPISSWTLEPAIGHNYGAVQNGTSANFNFTVRNTGNLPVLLNNVSSNNAAFVPAFTTTNTSIPVNGTVNLGVAFVPTATGTYSGQLKINSNTTGVDSVTTILTGTGFTPGTPPVLNFVTTAPYSGVRGVNLQAGPLGLYTYKIVYTSADNRAPQTGYPKVGIDRNGDGDFNDINEGQFTTIKEGGSINYVAGVVYTYTVNYTDYSNTLGYKFFATDDLGNAATTVNANYVSGPVVTYQLLDLRIFANNISFSKSNPLPGEPFTLTATVSNSSAFTAVNVPVRFYRDTILMDSAIIPSVNAFGSSDVVKVFSFAADGFYPIKVWIDSFNTLSESNILNNYAIRPINVGIVVLPGGITVTTTASLQACPLGVLITGTAVYYGVATPTKVAGGEVTINTGTQIFTTTTNANGDYSFLIVNPVCGAALSYTVNVTDFTFTSSNIAGTIAVPCPAPGACTPPAPPSGVFVTSGFSSAPCSRVVGTSGPISVVIRYRSRNLANFWNGWDRILQDTIRVLFNGTEIHASFPVDGSTSPGTVSTIPLHITLSTTGPNNIVVIHKYVYNEFLQIPSSTHFGSFIPIIDNGGGTVTGETDKPELSVRNFVRTSATSFSFEDVNTECAVAGLHIVQVTDSISGSPRFVIKTQVVSSLAGKASLAISFSDPAMSFGNHYIKIVTDADVQVSEEIENNNVFETIFFVPKPDLIVTAFKPVNTSMSAGVPVNFIATIKNTGNTAGTFKVAFRANGVQIGAKKTITGLAEQGSIVVSSDPYPVTTSDNACPVDIDVVADIDGEVDESSESNNTKQLKLGADLAPYQVNGESGSSSNPRIVRINSSTIFQPRVRNIGQRDISGVTVKFSLAGNKIGEDNISTIIKAGETFAAFAAFTYSFTTPGNYIVKVLADTANAICEASETNNEGDFYIRVVDANPDLEVLSQYISPSSLNPNIAQNITLVGTVKNVGFKVTTSTVLRFLVDDIQLGADVPLNALLPGQDTTVAATATYSSLIAGVKIMKIITDPANTIVEERENNNEATRALIVGEAPDMTRSKANAITFNPTGFSAGDSVTVSYYVKNGGVLQGTAWAIFSILDAGDATVAIDSVQFTLAAGAGTILTRRMLFDADKGMVVVHIVNCTPIEYNLFNNSDTLVFNTVQMLKTNAVVSGDLDMIDALPTVFPGWIGGKLVLGDYDLFINGKITRFDTAHFIITNGTGRLRFINTDAVNTFPVGTSLYNTSFVKINNTGTPDNYTVSVKPFVLKNGNSGDSIRTGVVRRTWLIEEGIAGGSNATIDFSWNSADEQPGFDRTVCRTAHYTNAWQLGTVGNAVLDPFGQWSKSQAGFTTFSPFTITSGSGIALPLRLVDLTVVKQGTGALLKWKTSDEINTDRFIIEHSISGQRFIDIGTVAAGNVSGIQLYSFVHPVINKAFNYYRLKMIDIDGRFRYSPVVRLASTGSDLVFSLSPNPAKNFINITYPGRKETVTITIYDVEGRLMKQMVEKNQLPINVDVKSLLPGMYFIQLADGETVQKGKFIKE